MRHTLFLLALALSAFLPPNHAAGQTRTFGTMVLVETEPIPAGPSPLSARTAAEWRFVELVYASLYAMDGAGGFEPVLASGLTVEAGGKVVKVALRDGAQWSIGKDITGLDIVYTYELARAGKWNEAWIDTLRNIESVDRSADGFGVVFRLTTPMDKPESLLVVPLIPSGMHGPLDEPSRQRPLPLGTVGAGPFRVAVAGDPSKLTANAFAPRPPKISEIKVLSVGERELAAETVRLNGDAVTFELARADAAIAPLEFAGRRLDAVRSRLEVLAFDPKSSPLASKAVRAAVEAAIDRSELFAPGEGGRPGAAPVSRRSALYPKQLAGLTRSAERARAALAGDGWLSEPGKIATRKAPSGSVEELAAPVLLDADDPEALRRAAVLKQRCAEVGLRLDLDPRPRIEFQERIRSHQFPAALVSVDGGADDQLRATFHTGGALNELGWSFPSVDAALDAGDSAAAVTAILESVPAIFFGVRTDVGAAGKNVTTPQVLGRGGLLRVDKWQIR